MHLEHTSSILIFALQQQSLNGAGWLLDLKCLPFDERRGSNPAGTTEDNTLDSGLVANNRTPNLT